MKFIINLIFYIKKVLVNFNTHMLNNKAKQKNN